MRDGGQVDGESGRLVPLQSIGEFLFDNDEMYLAQCYGGTGRTAFQRPSLPIYAGLLHPPNAGGD